PPPCRVVSIYSVRFLQYPLGLAFSLQRTGIIAWMVAMLLLRASYPTRRSADLVDETTMDIIMLAAHALNAKLVICGDPGQLQPVGGAQSDLMSNPTTGRWEHVVKMSADSSCSLSITTHELTDVLRSEDKIAHLAKKIREGVPLSVLSNNYDNVIETDKSSPEDILLENREVF